MSKKAKQKRMKIDPLVALAAQQDNRAGQSLRNAGQLSLAKNKKRRGK